MEHCAGGSLFDKLVAKGGITEDRARPLFRQIVESVEACHDNGIVHRDLKPENLLLDKSLKKITLIDFGLATYFVAVRQTTACPPAVRLVVTLCAHCRARSSRKSAAQSGSRRPR